MAERRAVTSRIGVCACLCVFAVCVVALGVSAVAFADHPADHGVVTDHHGADVPAFVEVQTVPAIPRTDTDTEVVILLRDAEGKPLRELTLSHERIMHVVIVSADFTVFGHIHPEEFGPVTDAMKQEGRYSVRFRFPKAGKYIVAVDSAYRERMFSRWFDVKVPGEPGMQAAKKELSRQKEFGGYTVTLATDGVPRAGEPVKLSFRFAERGKEVTDLQPYLAAPMHLAIILADLRQFIHAHGDVPASNGMHHHAPTAHIHGAVPELFGPTIEANVVFPTRGLYKIFGEVRHRGSVVRIDYMIEVE